MKAAIINEFGDPDVLRYGDVPTPEPKPGNVLVKVLASGVNRLDHNIREGTIAPDLRFPHILGADAAGEVAKLGPETNSFSVGERVIPSPGFPSKEEDYGISPAATAPSFTLQGLGRQGTYAQFIEVPARFLVRDDTGLTPEQAATLPVVLGSSARALKKVGEVKPGDRVLVTSGASGSGSMHIQVAKALGAQVATTVRDDAKAEFAKSLGADLVINTRTEDFLERVKDWTGGQGVDVVIDNLGGDVLAKSIEAARPQGVIVVFGFAAGPEVRFDIRSLFFPQKQLRGTMAADLSDLVWGLEQVREGRIKPALDRTLPLREASEAHRLIAANQVKGNIVLLPWAD